MRDYLELLKIIGNGIESVAFKRHFDNDIDFNNFMIRVLKNEHVQLLENPDGKIITRLTPEGKTHLKKESQFTKKWYEKPEWWGIIISGIIGTAGLMIAIFK